MSARIAEATALSPFSFRKRYRSSYETSSSSSPPTLPSQKRHVGTSEIVEDIEDESSDSGTEREGSEDEGPSLKDEGPSSKEEEEAAPEDPKDGRVYTNIPTYVPPAALVQTPPSSEWSSDEDEFLEVGAQFELHGSILHDYTQRLDALPPTLFRSLEREQERATMTFSAIWRPVLALDAWAGQTDAQRATLWHAIYDIERENHDLRVQIAKERRERLEMKDRVARIERR
ncbi:hypothetical protein Tco_1568282 [Tanacetum coccineum]